IVLAGHSIGSVPTLAALHFARDFETIDDIEIGLVFDPDDVSGPMTVADMERIMTIAPSPLLLVEGRWNWVTPEDAVRTFRSAEGIFRHGRAAPLLDTVSLASATRAKSIRVDLAEGRTATALRGEGPSHEVSIEIAGWSGSGSGQRQRHEIVDRAGYATLSARGVALCVERVVGLTGEPPPAPGLYTPEVLVEPAHLIQKLQELGTI